MKKGKLTKFEDLNNYNNVFQYPFAAIKNKQCDIKGKWKEVYFNNNNPIVLELGCGRGEYTVELAKLYPDINFIGVDIKGARIWSGATNAFTNNINNVAFLRTNIEIIDHCFDKNEVNAIWLTFSDPQPKNYKKRLTSSYFLSLYQKILIDNGMMHLKTDSNFLFKYTNYILEYNNLPIVYKSDDIHTNNLFNKELSIKTYYEKMWMNKGLSIKYIQWKLPHDKFIYEPQNINIEADNYKSFRS